MLVYIYLMHTKTTHIHSPSGLEPITAGKHLLFRPLCTLSLCQLRLSLAKGEKDWEGKRNELRQSKGHISGPQQSWTLRRLLGFRNLPPLLFLPRFWENTTQHYVKSLIETQLEKYNGLYLNSEKAYMWNYKAISSSEYLPYISSSVTSQPAILSSSKVLIIWL